jgi:hypothetical protein
MPHFFGDDMVLQTNSEYGTRAFLNGLASPGEKVGVTMHGCAQPYSTTADSEGAWTVMLSPQDKSCCPSKHCNISVQGADGVAVTAHNILWGDVFFCSGQSNSKCAHDRCPCARCRPNLSVTLGVRSGVQHWHRAERDCGGGNRGRFA